MSTTDGRRGSTGPWTFPDAVPGRLPQWVQRAWLVERLEPAVDALAAAGLADRFEVRDHPPIEVAVRLDGQGEPQAPAGDSAWPHRSAFGRARGSALTRSEPGGTEAWMVELVELVGEPGDAVFDLPTFAGVEPIPASGLVVAVLDGREHHRAFAVEALDVELGRLERTHGPLGRFVGASAGGIRFAMVDTVEACGWATEIYERSPRLASFYGAILG